MVHHSCTLRGTRKQQPERPKIMTSTSTSTSTANELRAEAAALMENPASVIGTLMAEAEAAQASYYEYRNDKDDWGDASNACARVSASLRAAYADPTPKQVAAYREAGKHQVNLADVHIEAARERAKLARNLASAVAAVVAARSPYEERAKSIIGKSARGLTVLEELDLWGDSDQMADAYNYAIDIAYEAAGHVARREVTRDRYARELAHNLITLEKLTA